MKDQRVLTRLVIIVVILISIFSTGSALAGGIALYEVGTADVGLASAGYSARAQDASTVLTNPAGMARLEGTQLLVNAQVLYADVKFTAEQGTSPALGSDSGGNPIGWFPGGSFFFTQKVSPELSVGFGVAGNFGLAEKYNANWIGRYYVQDTTLIGVSLLPSIAYRASKNLSIGLSLNVMYGKLLDQVAVNTIGNPDGQLKLEDSEWGWGANVGLLYEVDPGTRFGITYNSAVKLDFTAPANFSGLTPALETLLRLRGLLNANINLGITVPQGVMASAYHQLNDDWAILGSIGWQQWSQFGKAEVGITDASNPTSVTTDLHFKDTWHVAAGSQYRMSKPWLLNFGIAYDSAFQDSSNVSPMLPVNDAWRFGIGAQNEVSAKFDWGFGFEYAYGGTLHVNRQSSLPVAAGGRGDLVGSYKDASTLFIAVNGNWKF